MVNVLVIVASVVIGLFVAGLGYYYIRDNTTKRHVIDNNRRVAPINVHPQNQLLRHIGYDDNGQSIYTKNKGERYNHQGQRINLKGNVIELIGKSGHQENQLLNYLGYDNNGQSVYTGNKGERYNHQGQKINSKGNVIGSNTKKQSRKSVRNN